GRGGGGDALEQARKPRITSGARRRCTGGPRYHRSAARAAPVRVMVGWRGQRERMSVMSGERGPSRIRRWKLPLAVAAGVLAGALGTAVLLRVERAAAVAYLAPSDARVVSARGPVKAA